MTPVLVIFGLAACAGLIIWVILRNLDRALAKIELERKARNDRVRALYERSDALWYPHVLADDSVRWYRVDDDDALDM